MLLLEVSGAVPVIPIGPLLLCRLLRSNAAVIVGPATRQPSAASASPFSLCPSPSLMAYSRLPISSLYECPPCSRRLSLFSELLFGIALELTSALKSKDQGHSLPPRDDGLSRTHKYHIVLFLPGHPTLPTRDVSNENPTKNKKCSH